MALFLASLAVSAAYVYLLVMLKAGDTRSRRGKSFFRLCTVILAWTLLNAVTMIIDPLYFPVIYTLKMIVVCFVPFMLFWFILNFTESVPANSKVLQAVIFTIPAVDALLVATNPLHNLLFLSYDFPLPPRGMLFLTHTAVGFLFILIAYVFLFRYIIKHFRQRPFLIITGIGALLPYALNFSYGFNLVSFKHDATPIGFFFTFIIFAYFSHYSRMFHFKWDILRSVFNSIQDTVVIINREGYVVDANTSLERRFPEFIPQYGKTTLHNFLDFLRTRLKTAGGEDLFFPMESLQKTNYGTEIDLFTAGDKLKTFEVCWHVIQIQGGNYSYVMVLDDISEYRAMINEINEKNIHLTELKELAEEASLTKSKFLAHMSHEIRTPMNAILGMAELAMRENVTPVVQEHIFTIRQAGENLLSIINEILDLSKIEAGKLSIIREEYSFSSIIFDVINMIKTKTTESCLRFVVFADSNIPNSLIGDSVRIRQIMLNLLSNAVKYTEKGFISLSVTIQSKSGNNVFLSIEVADSGRGIKPEVLENLFSEFERFSMEKNKNIEGTGLGLAITKNIVNVLGGRIDIQSEYGRGSTFTVSLPQEVSLAQNLAAVTNASEKNVLVYERREVYANSIAKNLENLGVNYRLVASHSEFYDEIKSGKFPYVFIASVLYDEAKTKFSELNLNVRFVLIADFGEAVSDRNTSILTMPIFTVPIANFLNGVTDVYSVVTNRNEIFNFTAPEAGILIVDDIITNLKVAEGLLKPYQMKVTLCKSGEQALKAVKKKHFDLVFMDHMMHNMDGIETMQRIRSMDEQDPYYKNLPVIVMTANAVTGVKEMFLEKGFNDFLSKPIDTVYLDTILKKWIPKEKQNLRV